VRLVRDLTRHSAKVVVVGHLQSVIARDALAQRR